MERETSSFRSYGTGYLGGGTRHGNSIRDRIIWGSTRSKVGILLKVQQEPQIISQAIHNFNPSQNALSHSVKRRSSFAYLSKNCSVQSRNFLAAPVILSFDGNATPKVIFCGGSSGSFTRCSFQNCAESSLT